MSGARVMVAEVILGIDAERIARRLRERGCGAPAAVVLRILADVLAERGQVDPPAAKVLVGWDGVARLVRASSPWDLCAAGAIAYGLLTGSAPQASPQALAVLRPDLPRWVRAMIDRLIAADPRERLCDPRSVARSLERDAMRDGLWIARAELARWLEGMFGAEKLRAIASADGEPTAIARAVEEPSTVLEDAGRRRSLARALLVSVTRSDGELIARAGADDSREDEVREVRGGGDPNATELGVLIARGGDRRCEHAAAVNVAGAANDPRGANTARVEQRRRGPTELLPVPAPLSTAPRTRPRRLLSIAMIFAFAIATGIGIGLGVAFARA